MPYAVGIRWKLLVSSLSLSLSLEVSSVYFFSASPLPPSPDNVEMSNVEDITSFQVQLPPVAHPNMPLTNNSPAFST
jgi:hypothetical protein